VVGSICTYAGHVVYDQTTGKLEGETAFNGDGKNRLETALYWPFDIEFTARGRRIVLDWNNHKVREINQDDTFQTIVGTDFVGDGPPGPPFADLTLEGADGLTVNLNHPTDIQEFSNGDILFAAWHNHKFRQIDVNTGYVRVLLGAGAGFAGDGDRAQVALVNQPPHMVLDPDGNMFFIDQRNQRIRVAYKMGALAPEDRWNAIVQTVAGTGNKGFNGDGIALQTNLSFPTGTNPEPSGGIARDDAGFIYFADTENHRIRRIEFTSPDFLNGVISTIAGTGFPGYTGDGHPAQDAQINRPGDIEIGPDGNLYFADTNNNVVRMIDFTSGNISTVAGTGDAGYSGDGGPALEAQLHRPFGVAFDQAGDLYISDTFNSLIRKVKLTQ
jgi:sugar lactone lactonase YvrE